MKTTTSLGVLALALTSSLTSAQFLDNQQYGSLPACTSDCPALTGPQSQCGDDDWACFCTAVWAQVEAAPSQICAQTCTSPADVTLAYQWYTQNCGSDNGATAHPAGASGGSTGSNDDDNGGSGTSAASPSSSSGTTSSGSSSSGDGEPQSWWDGHWRWIVMIIVLFFGLLGLAMLGLWLKKRHYRRRDQITTGFNSGITERAPPMSSNPHVNDSSMLDASAVQDTNANGGRDSPVRTRDAFMPYGYGYTRSESRLGSNPEIGRASSPLARGQTPVGEMERGTAADDRVTPAAKKGRRVLVRERSGADSLEDVTR